MGRPSKLDDRQRAEIGRRLASGGPGNTVTELAKEFHVSKGLISSLFSKRSETIQTLANTLAVTEAEIERLPISEQSSVRTLADQLKGISSSLAKSAAAGARVSASLSDLAERHTERLVKRVEEEGGLMAEELKPVAALMETANRASSIGMGLLQANKSKDPEPAPADDLRDLPTSVLLERVEKIKAAL